MQVILDASQLLVFPWGKMGKIHLPLGIRWSDWDIVLVSKDVTVNMESVEIAINTRLFRGDSGRADGR